MGAHANQTACVRRRKNELNLKDAGVQVAQLNVRMKAGTLPLGLQYTRTLKAAVAFRICWPHVRFVVSVPSSRPQKCGGLQDLLASRTIRCICAIFSASEMSFRDTISWMRLFNEGCCLMTSINTLIGNPLAMGRDPPATAGD